MGSCNRYKGMVCVEEGEGISIVMRRDRRDTWVHW